MNLVKNTQEYLVSKTHRECTSCHKIYLRTSRTVTLCNECNSDRVKSQPQIKRMYARAKSRAKMFDKQFSITINDIEIPDVCPVMGMPLVHSSGKSGGKKNSPSLDCINPAKGKRSWVVACIYGDSCLYVCNQIMDWRT